MKLFILSICVVLNFYSVKASSVIDLDDRKFEQALRNSKPFQPITPEETQFIQTVLKGCVRDAQKQFSYTRPSGPATYRVADVKGAPQNLDKATRWRSSSQGATNVLLEFKADSDAPETNLQMKLVAVESDLS